MFFESPKKLQLIDKSRATADVILQAEHFGSNTTNNMSKPILTKWPGDESEHKSGSLGSTELEHFILLWVTHLWLSSFSIKKVMIEYVSETKNERDLLGKLVEMNVSLGSPMIEWMISISEVSIW